MITKIVIDNGNIGVGGRGQGGALCPPKKFGSQKFGQNGGRIQAKCGKNSGKNLGKK